MEWGFYSLEWYKHNFKDMSLSSGCLLLRISVEHCMMLIGLQSWSFIFWQVLSCDFFLFLFYFLTDDPSRHLFILLSFPSCDNIVIFGDNGAENVWTLIFFYRVDHVNKTSPPLPKNTKQNKTQTTTSSEFWSPAMSIVTSWPWLCYSYRDFLFL